MPNEIKDIPTTKTNADIGATDWFEGQTAAGGALSSFKITKSELTTKTAAQVPFTPAGNLSATDVEAALLELDGEKLAVTAFAPYVKDQASASTAGATITLDMNSQIWRSFVGSATFATPKTMALSNTTNSLEFRFFFQITNVAAVITFPSDWISADDSWDGVDEWTPPLIGKYYMTGDFNATSNEWTVSIYGPSA